MPASVDYKDPKVYIPAVVILVMALGAGSLFGFTVEPEEMTALRVENATLRERTTNLEGQVASLGGRVTLLEEIVERCNRALGTNNTSGGR